MKAKEWFVDCAKGASLGFGFLPGVSIGTIGLVVNVYDKLIGNVNSLRKDFRRSFLTLLPIFLGCVISALVLLWCFSKSEGELIEEDPYNVKAVIIFALAGVIFGGLPIILHKIKGIKLTSLDWLRMAIGFIVATAIGIFSVLAYVYQWFNFETAFSDPNANWWVYIVSLFIGFVAAFSCLVPGISGTMILFIFGMYDPVVDIMMGQDSVFHNNENVLPRILLLIILAIGIVAGLIVASKVMARLLEKHYLGTYDFVIGFIFGSMVAMFVNNTMWECYEFIYDYGQYWQYIVGVLLFLGVAALMAFLCRRALSRSNDNPPSDEPEIDTVPKTE